MIRIPTRLTNVAPPEWIAAEYSSIDAWSHDNAHLLLLARDHFRLYTREGQFVKDLPIGASERPRWSRTDSGKLTLLRGNEFITYDVELGIVGTHTFSEYVAISDGGEADQQGDLRVLIGTRLDGGNEVFVFDVATGSKGPVFDVTGHPIESLYLTPSGKVLISWA